ncbi:hypothetical protein D3C76_188970 [compost metagenome]
MIDVLDGLSQSVDHADRQNRRQVLGAPVFFGSGHGIDDCPGTLATAQLDAFFAELCRHRRQELPGDGLIDQQRFHGAADAITVSLGIERDALCLGQIGVFTHVNVADAVQVLDHRDTGITADAFDQATTAARHDDINVFRHGDQRADGSAIGGFDHLHHRGRQIGLGQAALNAGGDGTVGMNGLGTATQDGCVTGFQAQARGIDGHVRPRLVDDPDHAQWHAHLADLDTGRTEAHVADCADRVRQGRHLTQADDHAVDTRRGQCQALKQGRLKTIGATGSQILFIGRRQLGAGSVQRVGGGLQGAVFLRGTGTADHAGSFAGSATQAGHVVKNGLSHGLAWSLIRSW